MPRLLTLKEIAKQLNVPESSLRKYREIFSPFIPSVGTGRSRRYRSEAIQILNEIREMREDFHIPWEAITDKLAEKYPMEAETRESKPAPLFDAQPTAEPESLPEPRKAAPEPRREEPEPRPQLSSGVLQKISALNEKQAMMFNAMAMELLRAMESVREESKKESGALRANFMRTVQVLSESLGEASRQEAILLRDIQNRVAALGKEIKETPRTPQQVQQPPAPPREIPAAGDGHAKIAELQEALDAAKAEIQKRNKALIGLKKSLDLTQKENSLLKEIKKTPAPVAEDDEEEYPHRRARERSSSSSPSGKQSILGRIFGRK